ncbi:hypothetical protein DITRI_Ditri20bG0099800 [Diplodiscus trichospermus]
MAENKLGEMDLVFFIFASPIIYSFMLATGLMMALIGSVLSSTVAIIMPPLCFIKIVGTKATRAQIVTSVAISAIGFVCAIVGTYSSLKAIATSY